MAYAPPSPLLRAGTSFGVPQMLYVPDFLPAERRRCLLTTALTRTAWQQERFRLFGRPVAAPRLTAWFGDEGAVYRYSGVPRPAAPWPPWLLRTAREVDAAVGEAFNFVLVNRYRDGADHLGWHADDESDLGPAPVVAALSVGCERMFRVRPRAGGSSVGIRLAGGSLLLMWGASQRDFKHCLPRTRRPASERLAFTFRVTGS